MDVIKKSFDAPFVFKDDPSTFQLIELVIPVGVPRRTMQAHIELIMGFTEMQAFEAVRAGIAANPQRLKSRVPGELGRMVNHEQGADVLRFILQSIATQIERQKGQPT